MPFVVCNESGEVVFAYDPSEDQTASGKTRSYLGAVLSCPNFEVGQTYSVYVGGVVSGQETQGVYDVETVTGYEGGTQQAYTGTNVQGGPGGFGGPGGGMGPSGQGGPSNGQGSELPVDGNSEPPAMPDDTQNNQLTGNAAQASQSGSATSQTIQPSDGNPQTGGASNTQASTGFYMQDTVNAFSGVTAAA